MINIKQDIRVERYKRKSLVKICDLYGSSSGVNNLWVLRLPFKNVLFPVQWLASDTKGQSADRKIFFL